MATTRGKGTRGTAAPTGETAAEAAPRARRTRTRAPEDEISGTTAPEPSAASAAGTRGGRTRRAAPGNGVSAADTPAAEAAPRTPSTRGRTRAAPGTGVAETTPAPAPARGRGRAAAAAPAAAEAAPAAPAKRGRSKRETYAETAARRRREKEVNQLQEDLRAFAAGRPGGWNHDDWTTFLADLAQRGHDVSDPEAIGAALERERLALVLGGITGLGPKRVEALADRFRTLWSMRYADPADVAAVPGMNRSLAERVTATLRERFP